MPVSIKGWITCGWLSVALALVLLWIIVDVRNNCRYGWWGVPHTLARLPLASGLALFWPFVVVLLVGKKIVEMLSGYFARTS
jgi:hypothetical protein